MLGILALRIILAQPPGFGQPMRPAPESRGKMKARCSRSGDGGDGDDGGDDDVDDDDGRDCQGGRRLGGASLF